MNKFLITLILTMQISISQTFAQNILDYYTIGIGTDISYRSPYANNNWMQGAAVDLRINASGRIKQWEPEIFFRKSLLNFTDKIEYHDAKTIEFGVNGNYHLNNKHHVFMGGVGLNRISYQQYAYNANEGWSKNAKRGKVNRFVFQVAYQFNFRKEGIFIPAISIGYHNIRKFQIGLDFNFNILKK